MLGQANDIGSALFIVPMMVLIVIFGCYPVIKLVGYWTEGSVDGHIAFFAILMYVVFLVSVTLVPGPIKFLMLALVMLSAFLMPVFGKASEEIQLRKMADSKLNGLIDILERDPENAPSRMELARVLHRQGKLDEAVEHMQWTLERYPRLAPSIVPTLDSWKREQERRGTPDNVYCHNCNAENGSGSTHCFECGAAFGTMVGMKQQMWLQGGPIVLIRGWIVASVGLVIGAFVLLELPSIVAAPVILATVIVGAYLFLRWVGGNA